MKRSRRLGQWALVAVALSAGCQSSPLDDAWDGDLQTLEREVHRLRTVSSPLLERPPIAEIPADAGPENLVEVALRRNPQVGAAAARLRRLAARVPQAISLDDPMLTVTPIGEMAQTAAGEVAVMTGISQRLPFPGKLNERGMVMVREVAAAAAGLEEARLQVAGDVRRAYWSYFLSVQSERVTQQNLRLLEQIREAAEASYRAGRVPQQDVLRVSVEIGESESELARVRQRVATMAARLNQLMNRPPDAPLPEPIDADEAAIAAGSAAPTPLLSQAAAHNPQIERVRQQLEAARARLRLARLAKWPDLTISANYNLVDDDGLAAMANGDDQWSLGFGVNIPLWREKYRAMEVEALRGVVEAGENLRAAENHVTFRVTEAAAKLQAQQVTLELLQQRIIPDARQTLEVSLSAYRSGEVAFLTLIDNWRQLLRLEILELTAISEANQAAADLAQAVGGTSAERGEVVEPAAAPAPLPVMDERNDFR